MGLGRWDQGHGWAYVEWGRRCSPDPHAVARNVPGRGGGMDPQVIGGEQWGQISRLMVYLFLFTGLGLTSALGFLLGHAIIPSLVESQDAPRSLSALRWVAYPISATALLLMLYAVLRALGLAGDVMQRLYPRWWI